MERIKPAAAPPLSVSDPGEKQGAGKDRRRKARPRPSPAGPAKPFIDLVEAPKSANSGGAASAYLGPESRGTGERCVVMGNAGGPVMLNGLYNNNFQVVQTPRHVMIEVEMIHDARIIPIVASKAEADSEAQAEGHGDMDGRQRRLV